MFDIQFRAYVRCVATSIAASNPDDLFPFRFPFRFIYYARISKLKPDTFPF